MSKMFILDRSGVNPSMVETPRNSIPVYADKASAEADLANLSVGQIVATESTHEDDVADLKTYIRNQNVLSDIEFLPQTSDGWTTTASDSTKSTTTQPNNYYTAPYDGLVKFSIFGSPSSSYSKIWVSCDGGTSWNVTAFFSSGNGNTNIRPGNTCEIYINKGDLFAFQFGSTTVTSDAFQISARWYKLRDYTGR